MGIYERLTVRKSIFLTIFLSLLISLFPNKLSAQLVTSGTVTNAFIRNQYIEAGFNYYGCYASELPAPTGYIAGPNQGGGQANWLGFVTCPSGNWSDPSGIYGDFILPGAIYEAFSVVLTPQGGSRAIYTNDRDHGIYNIMPKPVPFVFNSAPGVYDDVTWYGGVSGLFDIECRFQIIDARIIHTTVITNTSGLVLNDVYFSRGMDPDQESGLGGYSTSETYNVIESQADGTPGKHSWVAAYGYYTPAMIGYYCTDPRSRVGISDSWRELLLNPEYAYGIGFPPSSLYLNEGEYSRTEARDATIELTIFIGTIPVGGSATVTHDANLDQPPVVKFDEPLNLEKNEGETFTYKLTREHQLGETVTATVRLTEISNVTATDFIGVPALPHDYYIVFGPGDTTKTLSLRAANDCYDNDYKIFQLEIVAVTSSKGGLMSPPSTVEGIIRDVPPMEICSGTVMAFTADPFNEGTSPSYQWFKNNIPISGATLSTYEYAPENCDVITCELTSDATCADPVTVLSSGVAILVHPLPSATIMASPSTVCSGEASTLTAVVSSGSTTAMTYTWYRGATQLGVTTVNTYNLTSLTATADYSVTVLNDNGCSAMSLPQTITVNSLPSVSLSANPTGICSGVSSTLTATVPSGSTTAMTYTWYKDGVEAGTTTVDNYTVSISGSYTVMVRNSNGCMGISGTVTVAVTAGVTPTINISASTNSVCSGTVVNYSSAVTNEGTMPAYQWYVNSNPVGTGGTSYSYEPAHGDIVTCVLTSNAPCASPNPVTSNNITMIITPTVTPSVSITAVPD